MGGPGPGHKSAKARRSQLANIAKARAARKRPPLPWRSGLESRIIEQLIWQWWLTTRFANQPLSYAQNHSSFAFAVPSGAHLPHFAPPAISPRSRRAPAGPNQPWPLFQVARLLGVSHTWIYTLVKRFEADPDRFRRRMAAFAPATFDKLLQAREETRRQRSLGRLRGPIRFYHVKRTLQGRKRTLRVPTKAEVRRLKQQPPIVWPPPIHVRPDELPAWARGILPPLHASIAPAVRTAMAPSAPPRSTTPRPVPFAFRRRRP